MAEFGQHAARRLWPDEQRVLRGTQERESRQLPGPTSRGDLREGPDPTEK